jgi:hypothetical protein
MPIEVRIGRRLLRTISPESAEARKLLQDGRVEVVALIAGRMPPARDH